MQLRLIRQLSYSFLTKLNRNLFLHENISHVSCIPSIRFHLFVPLFVILIQVEALKGLSRVPVLTPSPMGMPYHRVSPSSSHEDKSSGISYHRSGSGSPEVDDLGKRDREDKWSQRRFDARTELEGKSEAKAMISNPGYSPMFLAEKLAQEALGSKEMQDTIKDLTSLKGGHKHHQKFANEPSKVFYPSAMSHGAEHEDRKISSGDNNHLKHRTERNRKHRKHKNRGRKHHHKGRSKRNHSREVCATKFCSLFSSRFFKLFRNRSVLHLLYVFKFCPH